jgi:formamidopyrimidine-DNA glycosylase
MPLIMPEGPEVKTVAQTLGAMLIGKRLGTFWHSDYQLRHAVDYTRIRRLEIRRLEQRVVDDISCYGKLLFIDVDKKPALLAQLGMTGQLTVVKASTPLHAHTHIRWALVDTDQELRYVDPRRFGLFAACDVHEKRVRLEKLGPDPFSMSSEEARQLAYAMRTSSRSIKEIILDQSVVVGVGNIYASEALFMAGISPTACGSSIALAKQQLLIKAITEVLKLAYQNCGTTFSNYVDGSGKKGQHLSFLKVFQRDSEPCTICATPITRIKQGGRSTFFCAHCQPDHCDHLAAKKQKTR